MFSQPVLRRDSEPVPKSGVCQLWTSVKGETSSTQILYFEERQYFNLGGYLNIYLKSKTINLPAVYKASANLSDPHSCFAIPNSNIEMLTAQETISLPVKTSENGNQRAQGK